MRKILIIVLVNLFLMGIGTLSFADIKTLKDGLFQIDTPQGWAMDDRLENIIIHSPDKKAFIMINVGPFPKSGDEKKDQLLLKQINEKTIKALKAGIKSESETVVTILGDKETSIGGAYARRLEYSLANKNQKPTYITNFSVIYASRMISFVSSNLGGEEENKRKINKMINSVVFQK